VLRAACLVAAARVSRLASRILCAVPRAACRVLYSVIPALAGIQLFGLHRAPGL